MKAKQREDVLRALKARFEKNMNRHKGLEWAKVQAKLDANIGKLWSLHEMERTGGERRKALWPCQATPEDERVALDCKIVPF